MLDNSVLGHERQKRVLAASVRNNRLAHAYLFLGKEGVGKKTLALEFARLINCEKPDYASFASCGVCDSCNKQSKGLNPDITLVEAEGNSIKKDQIKGFLDEQSFSSFYNKYRIVVINDAEKITRESVPMLLKTIEEPLSKRIFILVASNPSFILPTIRSRCQTLKFGSLTTAQLRDIMLFKGNATPEILDYAVLSAEGSVARALLLTDEKNLLLRSNVFAALELYHSGKQLFDVKALKKNFDNVSALLTDIVTGFFYDVFKEKTGHGTIYNKDKESLVKKYASLLSVESITGMLKDLDRFRVEISRNHVLNQDLLLNSILIKGDSRNG